MKNYNLQHKIWVIVKKIGNLTFAIYLLLSIGLFSILGTIIEQDQSIDFYKSQYHDQFLINSRIIETLHLNHVYTSTLFLGLVTLFALSLIICTLSTQLPSLKYARQWKFKYKSHNQYVNQQQNYYFTHTPSIAIHYLKQQKYNVFHQAESLYGQKGLWGRLAPIFVHFSIIVLMMGSLISLTNSFLIQEMTPQGEIGHLKNVVKSGSLNRLPQDITYEVSNFNISYYQDHSIKQFYSKINLIDLNSNIKFNKIIAVNKPLRYAGLTFYQTDWDIIGLRIQLNHKSIIQIPVKQLNNKQKAWAAILPYNQNQRIILILNDLTNTIQCYDEGGIFIKNLIVNQSITIDNIEFQIIEIMTATGLQIKQDTGITSIYFSFFMLMISTASSYISYSQIWIIQRNKIIEISGKTNRGYLKFEEELGKMYKHLAYTTYKHN